MLSFEILDCIGGMILAVCGIALAVLAGAAVLGVGGVGVWLIADGLGL